MACNICEGIINTMSPSNRQLAATRPIRTVYRKRFADIATYPEIPESNLLCAVLRLRFIRTLRNELACNFRTPTSGPIGSKRNITHGISRAPVITFILFAVIPFCAINCSPTRFRFNICVRTWVSFRGHWKSSCLPGNLRPLLRNQEFLYHGRGKLTAFTPMI